MATRKQETRTAIGGTGPSPEANGVPEGWAILPLPDVVEINPPKPSGTAVAAAAPVTFVPMAAVDDRTGTIAAPATRPFSEVRKGYTAFRDGDVIMAKITPCMENGKTAIARDLVNGLGFGSTEFHVFRSRGAVLPEYLYHFFRQESFRREAEDEMTGSVGQKRVPRSFLESVQLPIPPLAEQERIVDLLEQLLGKLDSCRDRLERVPAILERFRQAVLAAACSGRLGSPGPVDDSEGPYHVAESDQGGLNTPSFAALPVGWSWQTIEDVCEAIIDYRGRTPPTGHSGIPHLRTTNIRNRSIDWRTDRYVSTDTYERYMTRGMPRQGDVLFTMEAPLGETGVVPDDRRFSLAQRILLLRGKRDVCTGPYLSLALSSPQVRAAIEARATGSTVRGIAFKRLRSVLVPVPPIFAQTEIVRVAQLLLEQADVVAARQNVARQRIHRLVQTVLARAFRGELVPPEADLASKDAFGRDREEGS